MNESQLARLACFVSEWGWEEIPEGTRRAARYQVINMIAAVHAAISSQDAQAVLRGALASHAGEGPSTVIASGDRMAAAGAAAVNAAYSMAHDFDDIIWMGHTCHSAVFASLAVAEKEGSSSEEFLAAVILANEVAGRVVASSFFGPLNGQMTTYVHAVAAAAATARLLKLGTEQTTHALAIALAQPNFALQPAFMRPSSKLLSASVPIQTGIEAAYFAAAGLTGATNLLEDERGFWRHFSFVPLPEMLDDLGEFWAMQTLTLKTYPGCHYFQTACEALLEIARRRSLAKVTHIEVATNKLTIEASRFGAHYAGETLSAVNVNFDVATTLAILLLTGRLGPDQLDDAWLAEHRSAIAACRAKISVVHDPALTLRIIDSGRVIPAASRALRALTLQDLLSLRRRYREAYASELLSAREALDWARALVPWALAPKGHTPTTSAVPLFFPSRLTVRFADGARETCEVNLPEGCFATPKAEPALERKWLAHASPKVDARAVFARGLRLESEDLRAWIAAVSPPR